MGLSCGKRADGGKRTEAMAVAEVLMELLRSPRKRHMGHQGSRGVKRTVA